VTGRIGAGLALCVVPPLLALLLLLAGVAGPELTLVYLSIAASLLGVPAMVVGIVLIVRGAQQRPR
jgi:hypothetical protein